MADDKMNNPELNQHAGTRTGKQPEEGQRGQHAPSRNLNDEQRGASQRGTGGPDAERKGQNEPGSVHQGDQGDNRGNR